MIINNIHRGVKCRKNGRKAADPYCKFLERYLGIRPAKLCTLTFLLNKKKIRFIVFSCRYRSIINNKKKFFCTSTCIFSCMQLIILNMNLTSKSFVNISMQKGVIKKCELDKTKKKWEFLKCML